MQWQTFDSADEIAARTIAIIVRCAQQAIAQRGEFRLVLAGGSTPLACYRQLAQTTQDWSSWRLFYGDERCLPGDDPERNHQLVTATGLVRPQLQHHVIPAEKGPGTGARIYNALIADSRPFDLVLLGMGEDGHTASLFPGHAMTGDARQPWAIAVHDSPKPPSERVSLTLAALQDCSRMLVLVSGDGKRQALSQWRSGRDLPVARVSAIDQATVLVQSDLLD